MSCFPLRRFLAGLVLSLAPLAVASAQTNAGFVATGAIHVGGSPYSSAVADLNHDGIPDVVIADGTTTTVDSMGNTTQTPQGIAVLLGQGNGVFAPAVHYATSDSASFVTLADVNGDGIPDVITANFDPTLFNPGGTTNVLIGNGDGTFKPAVKYSVPGAYSSTIYTGDFNGDGHIDMAVATESSSGPPTFGLAIFLNNGDGTFHLGQQTANVAPYGVADFNKDGKLDLVVAEYTSVPNNGPSVSVGLFYGNGNGTFTTRGPAYYVGTDAAFYVFDSQIAIGDFNEDSYLDVAIADGNTPGSLLLLLGQPNGSFIAAANPPALDDRPETIVAGDFNHDGHLDLAVGTTVGTGEIDILLGKGDGTFAYRSIYGNDGAGGPTAADVNGDGYLDLVTVNNYGTVDVLYGKPGGTFNAEHTYSLGEIQNSATATGDFNGDGIPDIAVLNGGDCCGAAYGTVSLMLGQGNGNFKPQTVRYKSGTDGSAFAVGDVNGDGKLDVVVQGVDTNNGLAPFAVLLGTGSGTFLPARPINNVSGGVGAALVFLADVNNDGKLDLVSDLGVALGNGNGTFQNPIPFTTGASYGEQFALDDFNGDGKLDVAFVTDGEPAYVLIFLGDGTGHFSQTASFSAELPYGDYYRNLIAVGHFTSNGALGVVAGSIEEGNLNPAVAHGGFSILGGNGNGTLMAPVTYQLSQDLQGFQIGDFNGDGLDDVAVLNSGSLNPTVNGVYSLVSLFPSKGDGTLLPRVSFGAGGFSALAAADFNADGAVDLDGIDPGVGAGIMMNSRGNQVALTGPPTSIHGQPVTFKATVTASFRFGGEVSGNVSFYDGTTLLGTTHLIGSGVATLTTSSLGTGPHTISAVYAGNASYNGHGSNTISVVVGP